MTLTNQTGISSKVSALELTLQQSLVNFQELQSGLEQLQIDSENYKSELLQQREKCERKTCSSAMDLQKIIVSKENIIQLVASALTKLNETKNLAIVNEVFKILCGETTVLTLPNDTKESNNGKDSGIEVGKLLTPKKELSTSIEDVSFKDESVSEIEGTPTGRTSPIIHSRKLRSSHSSPSVNISESRDKKKCPDNWPSPEPKALKLLYPHSSHTKSGKGSGKYKQQRLSFSRPKLQCVVDLANSPELSTSRSCDAGGVQRLIKKESSENDETILPSPTSGPPNFLLSRTAIKENVTKFKKPLSLSRLKTEEPISQILQHVEPKPIASDIKMEHSVNLLICDSPKKQRRAIDDDVTNCENDESMSLLQHLVKLENNNVDKVNFSPVKQPLAENMNIANQPITYTQGDCSMSLLGQGYKTAAHDHNLQSPRKQPLAENMKIANQPTALSQGDCSLSILDQEYKTSAQDHNIQRKTPEKVEPVYKEPTVRKKAEKMALPGWCCDECERFFGELYGDDPEMRAKAIAKCSKHRGRNNPVRPKTPPGFWNPRWDVPQDTEEFNRRNNPV